eukprot:GDKH01006228.1.p1 GENE.GDKH01006228.1~~GDKH01006228.1.p1  ORF type:complete len:78 (-),score=0.16 GDKH01006228.1:30-263(-)
MHTSTVAADLPQRHSRAAEVAEGKRFGYSGDAPTPFAGPQLSTDPAHLRAAPHTPAPLRHPALTRQHPRDIARRRSK